MDELLKINGIGKATAQKLLDAGFANLAAMADADPEKPVDGVSAEDWLKWIAAAKEVVANPSLKDTKGKGPVCKERVKLKGKDYQVGEPLPDDLTKDQLKELRALKVID